MTNEELKEKIVDILVNCKSQECAVEYCATCEGNPYIEHCREKEQADALIAAGLRFGENLTATFDHMALEREHELERRLAEAERRAELAERALFLSAKEIEYLNGNFDSSAEFFAKEKVIPYFMRQAEEELNKESKD